MIKPKEKPAPPLLSPARVRLFRGLLVAGGAVLALALIVAPARAGLNALLWGNFLVGTCLAGLVFVAIQHVTTAGWSVSFRRIPEAMASVLTWMAPALLIILVASCPLYAWVGDDAHHPDSFWFKHAWLNLPFFFVRALLYLSLWLFFTWKIVDLSRMQDRDGAIEHSLKNRRVSAAFLVLFGFTFFLASFDWLMSLEPEWFSTIFGLYVFSGMMSAGLAVMILLMIWLRRSGRMAHYINEEHLHGVGKLMFGFSSFWMYMWFSQYMLIWYVNVPEETSRFIVRTQGYWAPLFLLNVGLNWLCPFLALLPRRAKRNEKMLIRIAVVLLVGRWLDLYLMIFPSHLGSSPAFGLWEIGSAIAGVALFVLLFSRSLREGYPVPYNSPLLKESLEHHQ